MTDEIYVLQYASGEWVKRDDSTGPMSTGGYPFPTDELRRATQWTSVEDALKYRGIVGKNEGWTLHRLTFNTVPVTITSLMEAKANGDEEYLNYLRLKRKFGEVDEECPFIVSWVGKCKQVPDVGEIYCPKHKNEKCFKCGAQATRDCDHTGQFVCGVPMCDEHKHH